MTNPFAPDPSNTANEIYERDSHRVRSPFADESGFDNVAGLKEVETELAAGSPCRMGNLVVHIDVSACVGQTMDCCGGTPAPSADGSYSPGISSTNPINSAE